MFNYKYPLLEVVQAIEHLQETKGTTNTEVCDFVRKRTKNPNDPMKVLKTVCTLNKLVDQGILIRKGKRYSLPKPPPKKEKELEREEEEEEEEEEEDKEEDRVEEDVENEDAKYSCDDMREREEERRRGGANKIEGDRDCEEDDDDTDEDDEDDDDDDDDDDICDNGNVYEEHYEEQVKEKDKNVEGNGEVEVKECAKVKVSERMAHGGKTTSAHRGEGKPKNLHGETKFRKTPDKKSSSGKKFRRNSRAPVKEGLMPKPEAAAFCARDFIDSQYDPATQAFAKIESAELGCEKTKEISNIFQARHRKSRSRRSNVSSSKYRSRSPVKAPPTEAFQHRLAKEGSDEIGVSKREPDVEPKHGREDVERHDHTRDDHDTHHIRNSTGPTPIVPLSRKDSCINTQEKTESNPESKPEICADSMNQCGMRRHECPAMKLKMKDRMKTEGDEVRKRKRGASHYKNDSERFDTVCSICEKKKKKK